MTRVKETVSAVVVAAGSSNRMQSRSNKVLMDLGGITVLEHSLLLLKSIQEIKEVVLVVSKKDKADFSKKFLTRLGSLNVTNIVQGGEQRFDSMRNGVAACDADTDLFLIHDGARPFAPRQGVMTAIQRASQVGAAILSIPMNDTLKRQGDGDLIRETVPRAHLYCAQTPQLFRRSILIPAIQRAAEEGMIPTDEASILEQQGHPVAMVPGAPSNIKITTRDDLMLARAISHLNTGATQ